MAPPGRWLAEMGRSRGGRPRRGAVVAPTPARSGSGIPACDPAGGTRFVVYRMRSSPGIVRARSRARRGGSAPAGRGRGELARGAAPALVRSPAPCPPPGDGVPNPGASVPNSLAPAVGPGGVDQAANLHVRRGFAPAFTNSVNACYSHALLVGLSEPAVASAGMPGVPPGPVASHLACPGRRRRGLPAGRAARALRLPGRQPGGTSCSRRTPARSRFGEGRGERLPAGRTRMTRGSSGPPCTAQPARDRDDEQGYGYRT